MPSISPVEMKKIYVNIDIHAGRIKSFHDGSENIGTLDFYFK